MFYKGYELTEITADQWDGKSRTMIVKNHLDVASSVRTIVGYCPSGGWIATDLSVWSHCAELPAELKEPISSSKVNRMRSTAIYCKKHDTPLPSGFKDFLIELADDYDRVVSLLAQNNLLPPSDDEE